MQAMTVLVTTVCLMKTSYAVVYVQLIKMGFLSETYNFSK